MAETTSSFGSKRIAVVTGANKGIGLEISRQLASNGVGVVLTARDVKRGTEPVEKLKASGFSDVVFHQLDVTDPATIASLADFLKTQFEKIDILESLEPHTSQMIQDVKQDYIVSKAALNAYTRVLAKKYPTIAINAVGPGFTKTDINQNTGILTVEEAALGTVKLALIADTGISGLYFEQTEGSTFD